MSARNDMMLPWSVISKVYWIYDHKEAVESHNKDNTDLPWESKKLDFC